MATNYLVCVYDRKNDRETRMRFQSREDAQGAVRLVLDCTKDPWFTGTFGGAYTYAFGDGFLGVCFHVG